MKIIALGRSTGIVAVHMGIETFPIEGAPIDTTGDELVWVAIDHSAGIARIVHRGDIPIGGLPIIPIASSPSFRYSTDPL